MDARPPVGTGAPATTPAGAPAFWGRSGRYPAAMPRVLPTGPQAPTIAQSQPEQSGPIVPGLGQKWAQWQTDDEHVPELRYPQNLPIYMRMLTHPTVWKLYAGTMTPLDEYDWALDVNGAERRYVDALAADLGLPVFDGDIPADATMPPILPGLHEFDFHAHRREAVVAVVLGHYPFELYGPIDTDGDGLWHLAELLPIHPLTIGEIDVDERANLVQVKQQGLTVGRRQGNPFQVPTISADRLAYYVFMPTSRTRWTGTSALRPLYMPWLIHPRAARTGAINLERGGGVPVVETDETYQGTSLTDLAAMAQQFRPGENSGGATPPGAKLNLVTPGQGSETSVEIMRYHDESMAGAWQMMVRTLGQTATGSRALGEVQGDMEAMARRAIARWFRESFRSGVIRKWWALNVPAASDGKPTAYPVLRFRPSELEASSVPAVGSPPLPGEAAGGGGPANPPVAAARVRKLARRVFASADNSGSPIPLPDRPLRRQPYAQEVAAAVDFRALDLTHETASDAAYRLFIESWLPAMVGEMRGKIEAAGNAQPATYAAMTVSRPDHAPLSDVMLTAARQGAFEAHAELAAQGLALALPGDDVLRKLIDSHAKAVAQQAADGVSVAASTKAVQLGVAQSGPELAGSVGDYLHGLAHDWERRQMRGAAQQAINAGRFQVFDQIPAERAVSFYASELLDAATCENCMGVDGAEYGTLEDATLDYPAGGYVDCLGGPNCRGTAVAVLASEGA